MLWLLPFGPNGAKFVNGLRGSPCLTRVISRGTSVKNLPERHMSLCSTINANQVCTGGGGVNSKEWQSGIQVSIPDKYK